MAPDNNYRTDPGLDDGPPSYEMATANNVVQRTTTVGDDGRVNVHVDSLLYRTLSSIGDNKSEHHCPALTDPTFAPAPVRDGGISSKFPIKLNIVIQVVGSRGDVQPFVALGTELQRHGHRIRLATHNVFDSLVCDAGLEFYPIGGDPAELMAYMVRNPGLIPRLSSLRRGDIQRKRAMVAEMLEGFWDSFLEPDPASGAPFVANAIIANPPSFAHLHCAQAMGIPVHLMFTMPWTRTRSFPHPLTNLQLGNKTVDPSAANHLSYTVVEWLTWQGLGDVINAWRASIDLEEVPLSEGPLLAETLRIPFTYCWSPALMARPVDWSPHIDVCGFLFREPPEYRPPPELSDFLANGPPPIYIGFGSIVIDEPELMTKILVAAARKAGVRAIISQGWSRLGGENGKDIFHLGDCPHEWLFSRVAAVVHHGGAGTTAYSLVNSRPTAVVPFFGDQPFWGDMVAASGAGPSPIAHSQLSVENLAGAIRFCLSPGAAAAAEALGRKIKQEDGVATAVRSFHASLPLEFLQCDILKNQPAVWEYRRGGRRIKLSKLAASVLSSQRKIDAKKLSLNETRSIHIANRRWDPVSGSASALAGTTADMAKSTADIIVRPIRAYRRQKRADLAANIPIDGQDAMSTRPKTGSSPSPRRKCTNTAAVVAGASAAGIGAFFRAYGRGFYVDIPLAVAEGFRAVPRLYGEEVPAHEPVRDWRSGARVAGQNLVEGISGGFTDLVMQPYRGAVGGGYAGAAAGVAKGVLGLASKTASGAVGVVAYPGHGIYQSIRRLARSRARQRVMHARRLEGEYARDSGSCPVDAAFVASELQRLLGQGERVNWPTCS